MYWSAWVPEGFTEDLDRLDKWAETNSMSFNMTKRGVLHFDHGPIQCYRLRADRLKSYKEEKDLGALVNSWLNVSQKCGQVCKKTNGILVCMRNNTVIRTREALLRPHLQNCYKLTGVFCTSILVSFFTVDKIKTHVLNVLCNSVCLPNKHRCTKAMEVRLRGVSWFTLSISIKYY